MKRESSLLQIITSQIKEYRHRCVGDRAHQIWRESGQPTNTTSADWQRAEAEFPWLLTIRITRRLLAFSLWMTPLVVSLTIWQWTRADEAQLKLIEEGWQIMDLREAYVADSPGVTLSSVKPPRGSSTVEHPSAPKLRRVKIIAIIDQHKWNFRASGRLYGYDDDARLWIVRDRVINELSYGIRAGGQSAKDPALDPRPALITSTGMWRITSWIEKLSLAWTRDRLDENTLRILRRPLGALCGRDRREFLGPSLTPQAVKFLEFYEHEYGILLNQ